MEFVLDIAEISPVQCRSHQFSDSGTFLHERNILPDEVSEGSVQ